jgi:hypothetical protein
MGIINPYAKKIDEDGPEIRLLICATCKTIEVLDDYTGPPEQADRFDTILNLATEKHKDGVERTPHVGGLGKVKQSAWNNPEAQQQIRAQVIAQFDPNAESGLGSEAYAIMDTYREDAMSCWEKHLRVPACPDYKSDAKLLTPNTQAERKEAGLAKFDIHDPATQRYLCEYCPVHSLVTQMQRKKSGLYE